MNCLLQQPPKMDLCMYACIYLFPQETSLVVCVQKQKQKTKTKTKTKTKKHLFPRVTSSTHTTLCSVPYRVHVTLIAVTFQIPQHRPKSQHGEPLFAFLAYGARW